MLRLVDLIRITTLDKTSNCTNHFYTFAFIPSPRFLEFNTEKQPSVKSYVSHFLAPFHRNGHFDQHIVV